MEWKDISGYEGFYQVSETGLVKSLDRRVGGRPGVIKGKILKPCVRDGYHRVTLQKNGVLIKVFVHRLVATAFIGECPESCECCHNDGNRSNNHASNLRWDTRSANQLDRFKHGTDCAGENHFKTFLKKDDVIEIRNFNGSVSEAVKKFGIARTTYFNIRSGKTWKDVGGPFTKGKKKMSFELAEKIRQDFGSTVDLAKKYDVHQSTVSRIKGGKIWSKYPS